MPDCPDPSRLRTLELGVLPDAEADGLLAHVDACALCREMLARFQHADLDSRILRRAVGSALETTAPKAARASDGGTRDAQPSDLPSAPPAISTEASSVGASSDGWDIPDYHRVRLCGEGAFGTVWAVRDRVGVFRALKVIDLARVQAAADVRCRELAALEAYCRHVEPHANLIRVYHVGISAGKLYYTMDLADDDASRRPVRGELPERYRALTLRQIIQGTPISAETAVEVVLRLLQGLSRLHRVGLAHRDIKPANIVFVNQEPRLSDIGMITTTLRESGPEEEISPVSRPSHVGTPEYMPPDGCMDLTADTFAMARVLHELLLSGLDDSFPNVPTVVQAAVTGWNAQRLQQVLSRAASPQAINRYPSADRFREDLETCREWSYASLFPDGRSVGDGRRPRVDMAAQLGVAALNALPWVLGFILMVFLIMRLT